MAPAPNSLELSIDGTRFRGWESVEVQRSLQAAAGAFRLEVSDQSPWPIKPGQRCELVLASRTVIAGYVDALRAELSEEFHTVTIVGRDRTADLVDSSAIVPPGGEFVNQTVLQIAATLAEPYGVQVVQQVEDIGPPFDRFAVQPSESAWSALERACRLRGLLCYTAGPSILQLDRPGQLRAGVELVEGVNVLEASLEWDHSSRFATYIVRGQRPGSEFDDDAALLVAVEGRASDPEVARYRPLMVLAEGAVDPAEAEQRAQWEASLRASRASRVRVTVAGWLEEYDSGELWTINRLVRTRLPTLALDRDLLVDSVTYRQDVEGGTRCELLLVREDAYTPAPQVDEERNPFSRWLEGWSDD